VHDLLQPGSDPLLVTDNMLSGVQVEGLSEVVLENGEYGGHLQGHQYTSSQHTPLDVLSHCHQVLS
jgi:hypothetical protein